MCMGGIMLFVREHNANANIVSHRCEYIGVVTNSTIDGYYYNCTDVGLVISFHDPPHPITDIVELWPDCSGDIYQDHEPYTCESTLIIFGGLLFVLGLVVAITGILAHCTQRNGYEKLPL